MSKWSLSLLTLAGVLAVGGARAAGAASQYAIKDVNQIDTVLASQMDLAAIATEDEERDRQGLPPRFAIPETVSITPATRGTWESLPNGVDAVAAAHHRPRGDDLPQPRLLPLPDAAARPPAPLLDRRQADRCGPSPPTTTRRTASSGRRP